VRADALGEHVGDPGQLDHRPHAAAGDDTGAVRGGLEQHRTRAEVAGDLVRDRAVDDRDLDQRLARLVDALADRLRDLPGLAEPEAHPSLVVPHYHQRTEAEAPAALHDLRHPVDVDDLLLELGALCVRDDAAGAAGRPILRHTSLPRTPGRLR